jgi:hypothetical protein
MSLTIVSKRFLDHKFDSSLNVITFFFFNYGLLLFPPKENLGQILADNDILTQRRSLTYLV